MLQPINQLCLTASQSVLAKKGCAHICVNRSPANTTLTGLRLGLTGASSNMQNTSLPSVQVGIKIDSRNAKNTQRSERQPISDSGFVVALLTS